jgi:hypothetical protein
MTQSTVDTVTASIATYVHDPETITSNTVITRSSGRARGDEAS